MFEVAIIGGGPAGSAAAVYAARKLLKTILITDTFGGQSIVSEEIQNWIGTKKISGPDLAKSFEEHVKAYAGESVTVVKNEFVTKIENNENAFVVTTKSGKTFDAKTVLVATGGTRRKLDAVGASTFEQRGLTYCASCDGPLFSDMDVAVIGAGNAGFETAAQLLAYTKSVTLFARGEELSADPITVKVVSANPKMTIIKNAEILEVTGDKFVSAIKYKDRKTNTESTIQVSGVFVEIGMVPSTAFIENLVEMDQYKRIHIEPLTQKTSVSGIWAAGDCTDIRYHQNNIAAGDGVRAIEDIYLAVKAQ